jgi:2-hydroxy-3-oxopropionate reductase
MKLAFLGIGLMGGPMASRLVAAGFECSVWNRTRQKAAAIAGAKIATNPPEATSRADIIITMLRDGPATIELVENLLQANALKAGTLMIDMASVPPQTARDNAARIESAGGFYMDAPVSGGTKGARNGTLAIMAAGGLEHFERAGPVFDVLGQAVHVGPVGSGQLVKLANQSIVATTIGAVSEAMLMCQRGGADLAAMRKVLGGGFAQSRILHEHGQRMIDRNFEPGGKAAIQLKDMDMILAEAENLGLELPISGLLQNLFSQLCKHHDGEKLDHAGLLLELERLNKT